MDGESNKPYIVAIIGATIIFVAGFIKLLILIK